MTKLRAILFAAICSAPLATGCIDQPDGDATTDVAHTWDAYHARQARPLEQVLAERGIILTAAQRAELDATGHLYGVLPQDALPVRQPDGSYDLGEVTMESLLEQARAGQRDVADGAEVPAEFLASLEHGLVDLDDPGMQAMAARVVTYHGNPVPASALASALFVATEAEVGCVIWCNSVHSGDDDWFDTDECSGDATDNGGDDWERVTYTCWFDATQNNCAAGQIAELTGGMLRGWSNFNGLVTIPDHEESSSFSTGGAVRAVRESPGCPGTSVDRPLGMQLKLTIGKGAKVEEKSESRKHVGFTGSGTAKKGTAAPAPELTGDAKLDISADSNSVKTTQADPQIMADTHSAQIDAKAEGAVYVPVPGSGYLHVEASTTGCASARSSIWGKAKVTLRYETELDASGGLNRIIGAAQCPAVAPPAPPPTTPPPTTPPPTTPPPTTPPPTTPPPTTPPPTTPPPTTPPPMTPTPIPTTPPMPPQ